MDLLQCYQKLGLDPECSWKELQSGYRRLVQKWHPDRYQQHQDQQHVAAHRMLEINEAYAVLAQYYREHGRLPYDAPRRKRTKATLGAAANPASASAAPRHARHTPASRSRVYDSLPWLIVAFLIGFGIYYLYDYRHGAQLQARIDALFADTPSQPELATKPATKPNTAFFTYGDLPGRVYDVQGVPTRTEGNLWIYGESTVYFEDGVVASWHSAPGQPLRAREKPDSTLDTHRTQP